MGYLTEKRKQHPSPRDDACTAEAAPGRVGRDGQGEARRANTTIKGGPHLELRVVRFYSAKPGPNLTFRLLRRHGQHFFFLPFFFPILFIYVRSCLSPPSSRNADPGSHSRLFSPLPTTVRALHFYREKSSALSSLVDSRRIVPTHTRRSYLYIYLSQYKWGFAAAG